MEGKGAEECSDSKTTKCRMAISLSITHCRQRKTLSYCLPRKVRSTLVLWFCFRNKSSLIVCTLKDLAVIRFTPTLRLLGQNEPQTTKERLCRFGVNGSIPSSPNQFSGKRGIDQHQKAICSRHECKRRVSVQQWILTSIRPYLTPNTLFRSANCLGSHFFWVK